MNLDKIPTSITSAPNELDELDYLIQRLSTIRRDMIALESATLSVPTLHKNQVESARNLLHYLALRRHDLREIQERLAAYGLSSLGRAESHARANVDAIEGILRRLLNWNGQAAESSDRLSFETGATILDKHTEQLLGQKPNHRNVRIMVTMPSEAAMDAAFIRKLIQAGMNCMRINCAHDDQDAWAKMIAHGRTAAEELQKECRVLMDLAGPKLRTASIKPGPRLLKWQPPRTRDGGLKRAVSIWITSANQVSLPPAPADVSLPITGRALRSVRAGDVLKFFDVRGSSRSLSVTDTCPDGFWAESTQTTHVAQGTLLHLARPGKPLRIFPGKVGKLTPIDQYILLKEGDTLVLTAAHVTGEAASCDAKGDLLKPAHIGVTLPEVFDQVRPGESIWFDDGSIGGVISSIGTHGISVKITHAMPFGSKLRSDKGINLPDTNLRLSPLTDKDREDLKFIASHADLVGYSFVRTASDVLELQKNLSSVGGGDLGIVFKIETRSAVEQLSNILLAAMRSPSAGVMIARGDLAIECGWERMAEVQEEILWICEAAHVPVIWATQVLESLTKNGVPSRAEITDAAMGERAECVMLNKGPYVVTTVKVLDDILRRMEKHQNKKRSMLRHLKLADKVGADNQNLIDSSIN